jgi:hypothetical protein
MLQFSGFYLAFVSIPYFIYFLLTRIDLFEHFRNILFGKNIFTGYRISRWETLSFDSVASSIKSSGKVILSSSSDFFITLSLVLLIVMIVLIVVLLIKKPVSRRVGFLILFWILPYFVFFTLWETHNLEFKLNVTIPIFILFVYFFAQMKQSNLKTWIMVFLVLFIGGINFFSRFLPASRFENNHIYQLAVEIKQKTEPGSIIMIAGCGSNPSIYSKIYIPYFGHRNVYILDWMLGKGFSYQYLKDKIQQDKSDGNSVYILSELLESGKALKILAKNHDLDLKTFFNFVNGFEYEKKVPLYGEYYLLKVKTAEE